MIVSISACPSHFDRPSWGFPGSRRNLRRGSGQGEVDSNGGFLKYGCPKPLVFALIIPSRYLT